jgi:HSP20 family protein
MELLPGRRRERHPLATFREEMDRLFEDFFGRPWGIEPFWREGGRLSLDVAETEDEIVVTADLPGVDPKDIDITLSGDVLTIKGEKKEETEEKKRDYHRMERRYGSFSRSVALPPAADPEKVSASYKDGVLKVSLGKKAEAKAKSVKIEVK